MPKVGIADNRIAICIQGAEPKTALILGEPDVVRIKGPIGDPETCGAIFERAQQIVKCWNRPVVQIGRGRPDAIQRPDTTTVSGLTTMNAMASALVSACRSSSQSENDMFGEARGP